MKYWEAALLSASIRLPNSSLVSESMRASLARRSTYANDHNTPVTAETEPPTSDISLLMTKALIMCLTLPAFHCVSAARSGIMANRLSRLPSGGVDRLKVKAKMHDVAVLDD